MKPITVLLWSAIIVSTSLYLLDEDPQVQCDKAIQKMTAFKMCEKDEKCFRTVRDYQNLYIWTERAVRACNND